MNQNFTESTPPTILRIVSQRNNGIEVVNLSRYAICYILHGSANIYCGDQRNRLMRGDVCCLGLGNHYIEYLPEPNRPFEQIVIYYTPDNLHNTLRQLTYSYDFHVSNAHTCSRCRTSNFVSMPAWESLRALFGVTCEMLTKESRRSGGNDVIEGIRISEIFYEIASHEDCCLKSKFLSNVDSSKENFEQVIYGNVFSDISIEELARECNRSLTAFKKEFRRRFNSPPHRWIISQRLEYARLLLLTTDKSVSEIGYECTFPNTSHFIKLFRKQFRVTPATFRTTMCYMQPEAETVSAGQLPMAEAVAAEA